MGTFLNICPKGLKLHWGLLACTLLSGCVRYANDPMTLAPCAPNTTWTPLKGNQLVSASFCQTLVPPEFSSKDLNLAELIDIALQNTPQTKQTWAEARAAAAAYGQTLSQFYPYIYFDGSMMRQKATFIDTEGEAEPYMATQIGPDVELSFTLFDFGQRTAASIAARESLYYADWMHNQEIQLVIQMVMEAYYQYLYHLIALEAQKANLENAQITLDAANEKFSLGLASLGDVAQARSQFFQARIALTGQKQGVEASFARLASQIGMPANIPFKVVEMPREVQTTPFLQSVDELVAIAQRHRQDFLATAADIRAKEATLLGAKRAYLPKITTSLDVGKYWFDHHQSEHFFHWTALFSITMPIFDGFSIRNSIRQADANLKRSQAQAMQKELAIIEDVTVAHSAVTLAADHLQDAKKYEEAADLEFKIALEMYQTRTTTILNVVSAQSNLSDARAKLALAKRNWFLSLASIAYATGSLCAEERPCID